MQAKIIDLSPDKILTIQLCFGVLMFLVGMVLLFMGLIMPPMGVIDSSVLTAFGEIGTFASALCGMDYSYKSKKVNLEREYEQKAARLKKETKEE